MSDKRWHIPHPSPPGARELAGAAGVSPLIAELLLRRGVTTSQEVHRFLNPDLSQIHPPTLLPDLDEAVRRILAAKVSGESVLVHGDYDADGVCAAALLTRALRIVGVNARPFVPHRRADGYDLRPASVERAAAEGVRLIVTVDCGILAFEAVDLARSLNVDVIVTDHHEPQPDGLIPEAVAVVNPKRHDSDYPFSEICGTTVAYKLAWAVVEAAGMSSEGFRSAYLDLVAIATCVDCMPLVDENRALVSLGLRQMRETKKAGLLALIQLGQRGNAPLTARDLGFNIGPRINAVGRIDSADHALRLLMSKDRAEAEELAMLLDQSNRERQSQQESILQEAVGQAGRRVDDRITVVSSPRWHPGIVGIVASKLVESLGRPAVVIAIDPESGTARGSCRSIPGFSIIDALDACREHLLRCGGHKAAAGLDIEPDSIPAFRDSLQQYAAAALDDDILEPRLEIDALLPPGEISLKLAQELTMLQPFGHGNPEPRFLSPGVAVRDRLRLDNKSGGPEHLKLRVGNGGSGTVDAIMWRGWDRSPECEPGSRVDLVYALDVNEYQGSRSVQLMLADLRPSDGQAELSG